jgi:hypothetical protein
VFFGFQGKLSELIKTFRHIILEPVKIDAHVLVVYLEVLTAVILRCLRPGNVDRTVLPRSFLIQFVQRRRPPRFDLSELEPLFLPLQQLAEQLHLGRGIYRFIVMALSCYSRNSCLLGLLRVAGYRIDHAPAVFRSLLISRMWVKPRLNLQSLTLPLL